MSRETVFALVVVALTIVALGLAGHEDYSAQLTLDQTPQVRLAEVTP